MTVPSNTSAKNRWVTRLAWPLDMIIDGGANSPLYINVAWEAENNDVSIWAPHSELKELKHAPEFKLEK